MVYATTIWHTFNFDCIGLKFFVLPGLLQLPLFFHKIAHVHCNTAKKAGFLPIFVRRKSAASKLNFFLLVKFLAAISSVSAIGAFNFDQVSGREVAGKIVKFVPEWRIVKNCFWEMLAPA